MKSIRTKILLMIGGIAVLGMIASGILTLRNTVKTVVTDQESISELTTSNVVANIDEYFTKYKTMAIQMAGNPSIRKTLSDVTSRDNCKQHPSYEDAHQYLGYIMGKDKEISSAYVCSAKTDAGFNGTDWFCDPGFDLKTRSYWFSKQEDIKRGFIISQPFKDVDTGNMVIAFSAPVYDPSGKDIVGVAAVDVAINDISNMVATTKTSYGDGSYSMLVSNTGQVLASKKSDQVLKNVKEIGFDEKMLGELEKPTNKVIKYDDNGETRYGIVNITRDAGWRVLLSIDEGTYMALAKQSQRDMTIVYVISILVLLAAIIFVTRSIVAPLSKLTYATEELADGNLDTEIDIDSDDEIGRLAASMKKLVLRLNQYIDYINEVSGSLDRFSTGDLNIELKQAYDGEFAKIKDSLLQLSNIFKDTIGQIVETSESVASGSKEIANAAQVLAEGSLNQAGTTEELTATINDLSGRVSANASNALNASDQVKSVGELADNSNEQMKEMMMAITEINKKSSEISKVIKVIEDIAFQTNILALNAAVEAARAGEAGKGFAVVADEVRNLATKSADAAKETTHLIEESIKAVENGTDIADKTGTMLKNVIEGVSETVRLIDEISGASVDQATALKQTLDGIEQISSVVQTNAATAEESSAASDELSKQAYALQVIASDFKI
ncbi:methyl-accepting chemotaxis protein [Asaccharospora irregularis]|uniref:Methyl-accepting chemotaxis protein n=1 Tax=Asaccharospora irregularis DSM 2635 TaxID=1121321 RepID=A0A1M5QLF5_9FIRM|nr:methyl-accepting chemotaxis protein [Asaccharospora irregularis]SHH14828.1 methyl-accepting chemotaxis protein [Asaccharospora irregularis DSM 2635]